MTLPERLIRDPFERANFTISAGAVTASAIFAPPIFTVSLGIGVVIEALNFRALRRATQHLFSGELVGGRPWSALFALRFALLGVAMYIALAAGAHPIGLVIGLSTVVPAVVLVAWKTPPPLVQDPSVPGPDDPSWDDWNPWLAQERQRDDRHDYTEASELDMNGHAHASPARSEAQASEVSK